MDSLASAALTIFSLALISGECRAAAWITSSSGYGKGRGAGSAGRPRGAVTSRPTALLSMASIDWISLALHAIAFEDHVLLGLGHQDFLLLAHAGRIARERGFLDA